MEEERNSSWAQPVTFTGVANFARASLARLWAFQTIVAALAAAAVICFFEIAWVPVLFRAVTALPATGSIEGGRLNWPHSSPLHIGGSSFLWIAIDPNDSLETGEGPDLRLEFGRTEVRLRGLFGFLGIPYPKPLVMALNRTELEPWWGAWHPVVAAGIGAGVLAGLFLIWGLIALLYAWPVRLIAFYADREVSWGGAWRLASAALLPGALFFIVAILAYTDHRVNLVQFLAAGALHIMIGWVYLMFAPFCLPGRTLGPKRRRRSANPFSSASDPRRK